MLAYGDLLNVVIQNIALVIQRRTPDDRDINLNCRMVSAARFPLILHPRGAADRL